MEYRILKEKEVVQNADQFNSSYAENVPNWEDADFFLGLEVPSSQVGNFRRPVKE
jgi:type I site-specific restriction-modification system R (restriction) subunit